MIAFFDPRPGHAALQTELDAAIRRVFASGRFILDAEVDAFEQEFAHYTGAAHAVGVASGTDALALALRALGVGPGDEVITVANAGVPPVVAIRSVQAVPRFVDVLPDSLVMDPRQLETAFSPRTRCIVPVHLYGQVAPLEPILQFARTHGLAVVEDCAHAHGAVHEGRHVGSFGDVGCFSFFPTKNLGAAGDGGMCVTSRPEVAERLRMLRRYGFRGDVQAHCEGINSRLDELQAALLRVKLPHLTSAVRRRRHLASIYDAGLRNAAVRPLPPTATHAYHLYVVRCPDRARVIAQLEAHGIGWRIHYPVPVHHMEAYTFLGYRAGDLPVTEAAAGEVLSLPLYPELSDADVQRVIEALTAD